MNKVETARSYAKQTAEQQQSMASIEPPLVKKEETSTLGILHIMNSIHQFQSSWNTQVVEISKEISNLRQGQHSLTQLSRNRIEKGIWVRPILIAIGMLLVLIMLLL